MRHVLPLTLLLALVPIPTAAIVSDLSPRDIAEAVAHGKAVYEQWKAERRPIDDAEPGYVVDLGADIGRAILFTEFSAVALETRRWHAIAREPSPSDIERVLAPLRGRLHFSVTLVGDRRDFLRHYRVRLVQGDQSVEPASWDVYRASPATGTARSGFMAQARYAFPVKDLDLAKPAAVVFDGEAGEMRRFEFDLGRLR